MAKDDEGKEPSLLGVFDHIVTGGVGEIKDKTINTVTAVPKVASGVVSGVAGYVVPDLLPDIENIDKTVQSANIACYAMAAFGISGTILFSMRIIREIGQWRQWFKYRKLLAAKRKGP